MIDYRVAIVKQLELILNANLSEIHFHQLLCNERIVGIYNRPCAEFSIELAMTFESLEEVNESTILFIDEISVLHTYYLRLRSITIGGEVKDEVIETNLVRFSLALSFCLHLVTETDLYVLFEVQICLYFFYFFINRVDRLNFDVLFSNCGLI